MPKDWSPEQRHQAVEVFRIEHGLPIDAQIDITECSTATELEPLFAGDWSELMAHVRKHGKRIGDTSPIDEKGDS